MLSKKLLPSAPRPLWIRYSHVTYGRPFYCFCKLFSGFTIMAAVLQLDVRETRVD
ncbi:hypothetical protein DPMN_098195 [Dreissena polymorpha]|uniref:Uncharacterized protein n=1 Tax=Dreissena polymorpha TaxID=45954 RepID=A0A9D4LCK4_DREPO|nr:hypothetical protein DPMN_098195 [Dreissena polymorpha]